MTVCKKCGGTGEINVPVTEHMGTVLYGTEQCDECDGTGYVKTISVGGVPCSVCNGTGEVQTNEEWLHTLNTEQFAEELLAWWVDGADTYTHFGLFQWEVDEAKEKIMKWLKEKHDEM